ncbi:MAG: alkaline phosphatase family protein [Fusobacteriaceae bacterium]
MKKLILILIDGLGEHQEEKIGYMKALEESGKSKKFILKSELPSLSRPLYETILTGVIPVESGIVNNAINKMSKEESVFSQAKKKGLKTAAIAYHWIHELYNGEFNKDRDIEIENIEKNINFGRFYWEDTYPDSHLFSLAAKLLNDKNPDFLLLHTMNVDDMGHKYGGESLEYKNSIYKVSNLLSTHIPNWIEKGYEIIVTSDHGMDRDGNHGGDSTFEREVPFWFVGKTDLKNTKITQKKIAGLCCDILGVEKSEKM